MSINLVVALLVIGNLLVSAGVFCMVLVLVTLVRDENEKRKRP